MSIQRFSRYLETGFRYCLVGLLLYSAGILLFIFMLNWEARFFGLKLDGLPAGILLGIRVLIPAVLALILIRYPEKLFPVALASLCFFGFFFIDSSVTISMVTGGRGMPGMPLLVPVIIPAIIVISHFLVTKTGERETG